MGRHGPPTGRQWGVGCLVIGTLIGLSYGRLWAVRGLVVPVPFYIRIVITWSSKGPGVDITPRYMLPSRLF